jgi:PBSX family phage terminase large subunit
LLELSKAVSKKLKSPSKEFEFGEFSPLALDFLANSNAYINIQHGAVRSGKTINGTVRWLKYIGESPHTEFMQSGKTRRSLTRNVLRDEMAILDTFGIDYTLSENQGTLTIEDKTIWLVGFIDERIADIIKGMTIGGWYADETNTYPKSAVEEALDRCSLEGSKVFWTMNPDSPYHYIYTDYITNPKLIDSGDVREWHYTIDDNPNLTRDYIDQIKRRYAPGSVQYKRKVEGLWVIAEGAIYDRFIESQHTFKQPLYSDYDYYIISTDYGIASVTVFGLFGIKMGLHGNEYHLLKEDYIEASKEGKQLTDEELADRAWQLFEGLPLAAFYVPHDASSLRATLKRRYYQGRPLPVRTYTPDVLNDIRAIQKAITDNCFKIHHSCKNSIMQAQTYIWDAKAQERGESKPLKVNDHCPDMWRAAVLGTRGLGGGNRAISKKKFEFAE